MLRFGETKIVKKHLWCKKPTKVWVVNVDNLVISKLIQIETNYKYLIGYWDKVIRPLVLILSKMSGYVRIFKVKDGDKDKNNKLIFFHIDGEKLLENY